MKNYLVSLAILNSAWMCCLVDDRTIAQIVPDGTLPANSIVTPQGNQTTSLLTINRLHWLLPLVALREKKKTNLRLLEEASPHEAQ